MTANYYTSEGGTLAIFVPQSTIQLSTCLLVAKVPYTLTKCMTHNVPQALHPK
jgi:hypothetical protein